MPTEIVDRKITQSEVDRMIAPMELDFMALFKVMEANILTEIEKFEGTPEEFIDKIMADLEVE